MNQARTHRTIINVERSLLQNGCLISSTDLSGTDREYS